MTRLDHATAEGTFTLDGETFEVENNIWVIGDDDQCVIIDAPHNVEAIRDLVKDREVLAILLTHAHDDHCRYAPELAQEFEAPMLLNPEDKPLWELTHGDLEWDEDLDDGDEFEIGEATIEAIHTPGHSPGSTCLLVRGLEGADGAVLFSGDTLFDGGPGATGRSFSSREEIEESIRERLFVLPDSTVVHTGHGDDTTIGAEKERAEWL